MKMLRPFLSVVFGLSLLVQGFGVAAAIPAAATDETPVTAASMPCHGDAQDVAAGSCPCCNTDCPDMANCALGHMAAAPVTRLQFSPALQAVVATTQRSAEPVFFPSLLRPPIPSHV